jgi:putative redox protein
MESGKVEFLNENGEKLSGILEMPVDSKPLACAIFAHCFTCNKNLTAIRCIVKSLTKQGIAVLSFDFTGLGSSEGDFSDTGFSTNVNDIVSAAGFMEENLQAPSVLIGHSLGGAAVIFAAPKIPSIKAVATIGAPSDPEHVRNLLKSSLDEIEKTGEAVVELAGRKFKIKKEFIDDLDNKNMADVVSKMNKALLIIHSPQDEIVGIDNAAELYNAAKHPKSFISLDGADHLMSNKNDSTFVGFLIGVWAARYIDASAEDRLDTDKQVVARLEPADIFTTDILVEGHELTADEPESAGGNNFGPSPYGLLGSALAACTVMTMRLYTDRKGWDIKEFRTHVQHSKTYAEDCEDCQKSSSKIDKLERIIEVDGNINDEQKLKLIDIANKCPVHRTLHSEIVVETKFRD